MPSHTIPDHYALIGNPVHHSRSPDIHRLFAQQTNQRLTYTAMQVEPAQLVQTLDDFQANAGCGLNVTAPLKQWVIPWVTHLSPRAAQANAVNTIVFQPGGTRLGDNTDGAGFVRDITVNQGVSLHHAHILLLGAGGAAHGILGDILAAQPASVTMMNRTPEKAEALAARAGSPLVATMPWPTIAARAFDIIINTTSPTEPHFRLSAGVLHPTTYCYDLVYGPSLTPFLSWARTAGCTRYQDGLGMLVEQAAEAFFLWRHVRPDPRPVLDWLRTTL